MADRTTAPPRPSKVSVACLIAGAASFVVLVQCVRLVADQGSLEQQEWISGMLSDSGMEAQVSLAQALAWARWTVMGVAALCVVVGVFAVYTARGDRTSRLGLSVAGGLAAFGFLFLEGSGVIPAALMIYGVASLWSGESRAWFAALRAHERGETLAADGGPRADPFAAAPRDVDAPADTAPDPGSGPSPDPSPQPWGASRTSRPAMPGSAPSPGDARSASDGGPRPGERPYAAGAGTPTQQQWPAPPVHPGWQQQPAGRRRSGPPRSVGLAVGITSVLAGLVVLVFGANAVFYLLAPGTYREAIASQGAFTELVAQTGLEAAELARLMALVTGVGAVVAALAVACALWVLMRAKVARLLLTVLGALTIVLSFTALPFGLIWAVGAGLVIHQLHRRDANAWFDAPR
ncbi:MAG: hypothetical protein Q7T56_11460 [Nocardioidaceae bacterium]|nr:hypothetical protein [Nocardioidaceae bacterium]